jgi:AraC-like DNA-binding protein
MHWSNTWRAKLPNHNLSKAVQAVMRHVLEDHTRLPKLHSQIAADLPSCALGHCRSRWQPASNEMECMAQSGTATFASPDAYQAGIADASVNLILTGGGDFNARLTWLNLRQIRVFRAYENLPRVAFISLSAAQVLVSFPTSAGAPLTYGGIGLQFGDVVFHARGERMHQRTGAEGQWGLISLSPQQLAACSKALTGLKIAPPSAGRVLRPSRSAGARLLRLHSKVCRLAETRHKLIENPEVEHALEQELLHALVNCLTADDASGDPRRRRRHTDIMVRFEEALSAQVEPHLNLPELCMAIRVPERTLRMCCAEFLGMSPTRYHLLRRLNMARSALRRADPETASVAEIARDHQFQELGRFAVTYRTVFGEMPSSTLRRAQIKKI